MKNVLFLFLLPLGIIGCNSEEYTYSTEDPKEYLNFIQNEQDKANKVVLSFAGALGMRDSSLVYEQFEFAKNQTKAGFKAIKGMAPFGENKQIALRDAASAQFEYYAKIFDGDFKEVVKLGLKTIKTDAENKKMADIIKTYQEQSEKLNANFVIAKEAFMKENNIPSDNEPAEKDEY